LRVGYCLPTNASAIPSALALDTSNNVWVTDEYSNALVELSSQGSKLANVGPTYTPDPINLPDGVAIDANNSAWIANDGNNNFVEYAPSEGVPLSFSQADIPPPGSTPMLTFAAFDGAGNSWYSLDNAFCSSSTVCFGVAEVSGAGRPLSGPGYIISGNSNYDADVYATAIDGSGDVWMLNKNAQSVTELIGAAAPVVTPLALGVSTNRLGVRP
jgi:DNA-binding beta-propeller fold protein YncE